MQEPQAGGESTRASAGTYAPSAQSRQARGTGRPKTSRRRMSPGRRLWYGLLGLLVRGFVRTLWSTCRVRVVLGAEHLDRLRQANQPAVIVYWHQQQVFTAWYLFQEVRRGLPLAYLVSPSVSGELPAAIIRRWGAMPVRGSSTRSSGETLRDLYRVLTQDRQFLAIAADGPKGPLHEVKPGAVMLAKMTRSGILPLSYAARRSIRWPSWDRFVIPLPFTEIVVAVGEPVTVPATVSLADPSPLCREVAARLTELEALARDRLGLRAPGG